MLSKESKEEDRTWLVLFTLLTPNTMKGWLGPRVVVTFLEGYTESPPRCAWLNTSPPR